MKGFRLHPVMNGARAQASQRRRHFNREHRRVSAATGAPVFFPVAAVADHEEVRRVRRVEVLSDKTISMRMLFDPGHSLEERILREQFGY